MKFIGKLKAKFEAWVWDRTPHCVEITRLASSSLEKPLTVRKRLLVRLHFVICPWCRRYFEQVHFLHNNAPKLEDQPGISPRHVLGPEARERILSEIRKKNPPQL